MVQEFTWSVGGMFNRFLISMRGSRIDATESINNRVRCKLCKVELTLSADNCLSRHRLQRHQLSLRHVAAAESEEKSPPTEAQTLNNSSNFRQGRSKIRSIFKRVSAQFGWIEASQTACKRAITDSTITCMLCHTDLKMPTGSTLFKWSRRAFQHSLSSTHKRATQPAGLIEIVSDDEHHEMSS